LIQTVALLLAGSPRRRLLPRAAHGKCSACQAGVGEANPPTRRSGALKKEELK
jgi:hypothetical protein